MTLAPSRVRQRGPVSDQSPVADAPMRTTSGNHEFPFDPIATWTNPMLSIELPNARESDDAVDPTCIFCKSDDPTLNSLIRRRGTVFTRWDNFPASRGHVEIVPFRHVQSFFDLTPPEVKDLHEVAKRVKEDLERHLRPDGYTIGVNDGSAAGRTVPHLHMHIIPRWFGDVPDPRGGIRRIFPECNPDDWLR